MTVYFGSWFEEIRSIMARRLSGRSARLLGTFLSMVRKQRETDAAHSWFSPLCTLIPPGTLSCDSVSVTFRVVFHLH